MTLFADCTVEGISDCSPARRPRQCEYWSRDDRTGLVGNRASSLDAGDGFTSSPGYHVASAALERVLTAQLSIP